MHPIRLPKPLLKNFNGPVSKDFSNKVITDDVLARLLSFNNVIVTAHQGFFTQEALRNIATTTLENISDFFLKHKLPNEVSYKSN
jgi:D-lactate dehydrogenase